MPVMCLTERKVYDAFCRKGPEWMGLSAAGEWIQAQLLANVSWEISAAVLPASYDAVPARPQRVLERKRDSANSHCCMPNSST